MSSRGGSGGGPGPGGGSSHGNRRNLNHPTHRPSQTNHPSNRTSSSNASPILNLIKSDVEDEENVTMDTSSRKRSRSRPRVLDLSLPTFANKKSKANDSCEDIDTVTQTDAPSHTPRPVVAQPGTTSSKLIRPRVPPFDTMQAGPSNAAVSSSRSGPITSAMAPPPSFTHSARPPSSASNSSSHAAQIPAAMHKNYISKEDADNLLANSQRLITNPPPSITERITLDRDANEDVIAEDLESMVRERGYRIIKVKGDGNCFFYSMSILIFLRSGHLVHHLTLRRIFTSLLHQFQQDKRGQDDNGVQMNPINANHIEDMYEDKKYDTEAITFFYLFVLNYLRFTDLQIFISAKRANRNCIKKSYKDNQHSLDYVLPTYFEEGSKEFPDFPRINEDSPLVASSFNVGPMFTVILHNPHIHYNIICTEQQHTHYYTHIDVISKYIKLPTEQSNSPCLRVISIDDYLLPGQQIPNELLYDTIEQRATKEIRSTVTSTATSSTSSRASSVKKKSDASATSATTSATSSRNALPAPHNVNEMVDSDNNDGGLGGGGGGDGGHTIDKSDNKTSMNRQTIKFSASSAFATSIPNVNSNKVRATINETSDQDSKNKKKDKKNKKNINKQSDAKPVPETRHLSKDAIFNRDTLNNVVERMHDQSWLADMFITLYLTILFENDIKNTKALEPVVIQLAISNDPIITQNYFKRALALSSKGSLYKDSQTNRFNKFVNEDLIPFLKKDISNISNHRPSLTYLGTTAHNYAARKKMTSFNRMASDQLYGHTRAWMEAKFKNSTIGTTFNNLHDTDAPISNVFKSWFKKHIWPASAFIDWGKYYVKPKDSNSMKNLLFNHNIDRDAVLNHFLDFMQTNLEMEATKAKEKADAYNELKAKLKSKSRGKSNAKSNANANKRPPITADELVGILTQLFSTAWDLCLDIFFRTLVPFEHLYRMRKSSFAIIKKGKPLPAIFNQSSMYLEMKTIEDEEIAEEKRMREAKKAASATTSTAPSRDASPAPKKRGRQPGSKNKSKQPATSTITPAAAPVPPAPDPKKKKVKDMLTLDMISSVRCLWNLTISREREDLSDQIKTEAEATAKAIAAMLKEEEPNTIESSKSSAKERPSNTSKPNAQSTNKKKDKSTKRKFDPLNGLKSNKISPNSGHIPNHCPLPFSLLIKLKKDGQLKELQPNLKVEQSLLKKHSNLVEVAKLFMLPFEFWYRSYPDGKNGPPGTRVEEYVSYIETDGVSISFIKEVHRVKPPDKAKKNKKSSRDDDDDDHDVNAEDDDDCYVDADDDAPEHPTDEHECIENVYSKLHIKPIEIYISDGISFVVTIDPGRKRWIDILVRSINTYYTVRCDPNNKYMDKDLHISISNAEYRAMRGLRRAKQATEYMLNKPIYTPQGLPPQSNEFVFAQPPSLHSTYQSRIKRVLKFWNEDHRFLYVRDVYYHEAWRQSRLKLYSNTKAMFRIVRDKIAHIMSENGMYTQVGPLLSPPIDQPDQSGQVVRGKIIDNNHKIINKCRKRIKKKRRKSQMRAHDEYIEKFESTKARIAIEQQKGTIPNDIVLAQPNGRILFSIGNANFRHNTRGAQSMMAGKKLFEGLKMLGEQACYFEEFHTSKCCSHCGQVLNKGVINSRHPELVKVPKEQIVKEKRKPKQFIRPGRVPKLRRVNQQTYFAVGFQHPPKLPSNEAQAEQAPSPSPPQRVKQKSSTIRNGTEAIKPPDQMDYDCDDDDDDNDDDNGNDNDDIVMSSFDGNQMDDDDEISSSSYNDPNITTMMYKHKRPNRFSFAVLLCTSDTCVSRLWNRDINACRNAHTYMAFAMTYTTRNLYEDKRILPEYLINTRRTATA